MDLLDQALENSQDVKDGECSPTSSETAAMVAAETCLVVEGGREVLAMVEEDDDDGGRMVSEDEDDVPPPPVLHRAPQVVIQTTAGRQRRQPQSRRSNIMLHAAPAATQDLIQQEQFEFRADNGGGGPPGTVTYRVVQVAPSSAGGSNSNDEMDTIPQIMSSNSNYSGQTGQFFVIGSPQEMFTTGNQRNIAPRSTLADTIGRGTSFTESCAGNTDVEILKCEPGLVCATQRRGARRSNNTNDNDDANLLCLPQRRDERRRATHNEVERRRRDKINNWIMKLGKIIPECSSDQTKQGQVSFEGQSKGGILAKACEYIVELRTANQRMGDCIKENERLAMQVEALRHQNEELRQDSATLRSQLTQHGITPMPSSSASSSPTQRARNLSS